MTTGSLAGKEVHPHWRPFLVNYRAREMEMLAQWILSGESGAVVGLAGTGRATLLGFLCHRPDALALYLGAASPQVRLIPVDLNNLPEHDLATLYRVILRSFYENREHFDKVVQPQIEAVFRHCERATDPFLPQSGLRELLLYFQAQQTRVVLVMNRFDSFCQAATVPMTNTLRGLRDSFKETLSYIMGMRQDVVYLSGLESVAPLRSLLDTHVCWVRPLSAVDGRFMVEYQLRDLTVPREHVTDLLRLTGGYPSLLRVACHWYRRAQLLPPYSQWQEMLLAQPNTQHRLKEWWLSLNQEEQAVLDEVQKLQTQAKVSRAAQSELRKQYAAVLAMLREKGVLNKADRINGDLLSTHVAQMGGRSRGRLWRNAETDQIYQGQKLIGDLAPQEHALLRFMLDYPHARLTHDDIIEGVWPLEHHEAGLRTDALYQTVRGTRTKIEVNASDPRYLVTWRGQPEGGYQLFPEGKPSITEEWG